MKGYGQMAKEGQTLEKVPQLKCKPVLRLQGMNISIAGAYSSLSLLLLLLQGSGKLRFNASLGAHVPAMENYVVFFPPSPAHLNYYISLVSSRGLVADWPTPQMTFQLVGDVILVMMKRQIQYIKSSFLLPSPPPTSFEKRVLYTSDSGKWGRKSN